MNARGRPLVAPTNLFFMVGKTALWKASHTDGFFVWLKTRSEQKFLEFGVAGGNRRFPNREVSSNEIFSGTASAVEKMSSAEYPPSPLKNSSFKVIHATKKTCFASLFCFVEEGGEQSIHLSTLNTSFKELPHSSPPRMFFFLCGAIINLNI